MLEKQQKRNFISLQPQMSDSSSSPNLLDKDDDDVSPISSTAKDNTSSAVDASGVEDSSWRKQSDTSSSPNLLVKCWKSNKNETSFPSNPR